jgi:hypothetical protein
LEYSKPVTLFTALPWASDSLNALTDLAAQLQLLIAGVIAHPVWALVLLAVSIGLLQIAIDLIKRALKAAITLTLKLPLNLSQWLWQRATAPSPDAQQAQIDQLINHLDTLQQDQIQTLAQLKQLLSQSTPTPLQPSPRVLRKLAAPADGEVTAAQSSPEA